MVTEQKKATLVNVKVYPKSYWSRKINISEALKTFFKSRNIFKIFVSANIGQKLE